MGIICQTGNTSPWMDGDDKAIADHVRLSGDRVKDQMSIFSAISIASSTSMPR